MNYREEIIQANLRSFVQAITEREFEIARRQHEDMLNHREQENQEWWLQQDQDNDWTKTNQ